MSDTDGSTTVTPADVANMGNRNDAPEFTQEYVQGLRQEAAKYRNEKKQAVEDGKAEARAEVVKEYEEKLAESDTSKTDLQNQLDEVTLEVTKLKAVLAAGLDNSEVLEVVELVQGTDEDSINKSVKRVKDLLNKPGSKGLPVDYSQGKGNPVPPLNGDPVLNMLKRAVGAD